MDQVPQEAQAASQAIVVPVATSQTSVTDNDNQRLAEIKRDFLNFLATATQSWEPNQTIKRITVFGEDVSCAAWEGRYFITGTDIVKVVGIRYRLDGHALPDKKKFEEGVFSDLRNLKPGLHAVLEKPHSKFLDFLYLNNCVRTHKKQKVFYWECVPHEKLYQEALRRDERRIVNTTKPSASAIQKLSSGGKLKKEELIKIKSILNERLRDLERESNSEESQEDERSKSTPASSSRSPVSPPKVAHRKSLTSAQTSSISRILPTFQTPRLPSIHNLLSDVSPPSSSASKPGLGFGVNIPGINTRNVLPSQRTAEQLKSTTRWNYDPAQRHIPPLPPPTVDYGNQGGKPILPSISTRLPSLNFLN